MDSPPIPKPRSAFGATNETIKRPVPLPRTKVVQQNSTEKVTASDILRTIGTVSKQFTEDVTQKVQNSAKSANERIEKSIFDSSKFAKGTLEKTLTTSRAMRDSVTKSVIEGTRTAGLRLRRAKKSNENVNDNDLQRCMSMPVVDVSLFDNIQFHSPLLEQKKINNRNQMDWSQKNQELPFLNLNSTNYDEVSLFSSNSDSYTDTASNFSYDSKDNEQNMSSLTLDSTHSTYDTPKASRANSEVGVAPEIPERRKKRDSNISFMRQNSLYENWNLPGEPLLSIAETTPRPSQSTIFEFDPLNTSAPKFDGVSNELLLLESFLTGDTYSTIIATDNSEDNFEEYIENDYFNPPTPPERSDSLLQETEVQADLPTANNKDKNSNWFILQDDSKPLEEDASKPGNLTVRRKFTNIWDNVMNKTPKQVVNKVETVERPPISNDVHFHSGMLTRMGSGTSGVEDLFKNSQTRYCVLSDQKMLCYTDPTNLVLKESLSLESIYSLQMVLPLSSSTSNNSYSFELSVSSGLVRSTPRKVVFSCNSASERRNWAQKIVENLTTYFQPKYTSEFTRCGWCYLKEGVSGEWQGAWVMLIRRVLVYTRDDAVKTVDLRKTRCVVTQEADEETKKCCPADDSGNLLLDCPIATLYLRFPHERELKGWRYMVKLAAHNNGTHLHHQQLTKEDVPTIVDKCISFIYAHGSMTEGIYRRAGSSSTLSELLERFRRDAWAVQLCPRAHSEHDVAGVLKRFFRDLPEPLIPTAIHQELIAALAINDENARFAEMHRLMNGLPLVPRQTARKLFAHLHFLHTMADSNKMAADNLAAVWAPTIMPPAVAAKTLQTAWSSKEVYVVRELTLQYWGVWRGGEAERRREAAVRRVLRGAGGPPPPPPPAGALRMWVYVRDRGTCSQIALTPSKTCADVCVELCEKAKTDSHLLMLEEVICGDSMKRIVHIDEIVLDVVLRWGYWDEEDRKNNYLIINDNKMLHDIEALRSTTSLVCGELKFANEASKAFKTYMFELKNGKLCNFKDKQGSHQLEEWNVKDIIWYMGHEPKRNPQTRWSITFVSRNSKQKRSKDRPWFGCTIAGAVSEDQLRWAAAMMFGHHSNILPTPRLVIT